MRDPKLLALVFLSVIAGILLARTVGMLSQVGQAETLGDALNYVSGSLQALYLAIAVLVVVCLGLSVAVYRLTYTVRQLKETSP